MKIKNVQVKKECFAGFDAFSIEMGGAEHEGARRFGQPARPVGAGRGKVRERTPQSTAQDIPRFAGREINAFQRAEVEATDKKAENQIAMLAPGFISGTFKPYWRIGVK
jgi:hypothetical protein